MSKTDDAWTLVTTRSSDQGGPCSIGPSACHAAHDGERVLGRATPVFPGSRLVDAQLGMLAALAAPRSWATERPSFPRSRRTTAWLGMLDSNRRIRPRVI